MSTGEPVAIPAHCMTPLTHTAEEIEQIENEDDAADNDIPMTTPSPMFPLVVPPKMMNLKQKRIPTRNSTEPRMSKVPTSQKRHPTTGQHWPAS